MFLFNPEIRESLPALRVGSGDTAEIVEGLTFPHRALDDAPIISKILAVGAAYDNLFRANPKLHIRDRILIKQALSTAVTLGFSLPEMLTIETVNLNQGQDYHSAEIYQSDLVVLCCIPKWGNSNPFKIHESRLISPYGNSPRKWKNSLKKRNPLMAVSSEATNYRGEITVRRSRPDTYKEVQPVNFHAEIFRPNEPRDFTMHVIVRRDIAMRLAL